MKQLRFKILTTLMVVAICASLIYLTLAHFKSTLHDHLVQAVLWTLSEEERKGLYYEVAAATPGIWEVVADPQVARIAKRDIVANLVQAEVRTNNAGFRSSKPFGKKDPNRFRIVCLGDSFVFGHGGLEEDRFCDQIEAFYRQQEITVGDREIETYALGISGWTAVQEATYLSTRISAYEPDVVVVLTVGNDITDSFGVTGGGTATTAFSPESRHLGSGAFSATAGEMFGYRGQTALSTDVCPQGRERWVKAMGALRRLAEVQTRRGGRILNSVSLGSNERGSHFVELYKHYYAEHGPTTPFVVTSFFRSEETKLAHDSHPNRRGHSIFAHHYIHMFDRLGWIPVAEDRLPPLDQRLSLDTNPALELESLERYRREFMRVGLERELDFTRLDRQQTMGFLGGILPDEIGPRAFDAAPWASVRSGFLLRRKNLRRAANVVVEIRIPARMELFPMRIDMSINGTLAGTFDFAEPGEAGRQVLIAPLETPGTKAVEIVLRTDSYFSEIEDHRMKSFQLLSAELRDVENGGASGS